LEAQHPDKESKMKKLFLTTAICSALALGMAPASYAASPGQQSVTSTVQSDNAKATTAKIGKETQKLIVKDAIDAFAQTNVALAALQNKDIETALTALGKATGKFELVISADPDLALAPIDESETLTDINIDPQSVDAARLRAIKMLREGDLQDARSLLADMASELVIETTSIPMATYPDAIKAVVPLITAGKIDQAITALQAAMNTLVITDVVIPLPTLRATTAIEAAQTIATSKTKLTPAQLAKVNEHLDYARSQLRLAVSLGYADRGAYKSLHADIEQVRKQVNGGNKAEKAFKDILSKLKASSTSAAHKLKKAVKAKTSK